MSRVEGFGGASAEGDLCYSGGFGPLSIRDLVFLWVRDLRFLQLRCLGVGGGLPPSCEDPPKAEELRSLEAARFGVPAAEGSWSQTG